MNIMASIGSGKEEIKLVTMAPSIKYQALIREGRDLIRNNGTKPRDGTNVQEEEDKKRGFGHLGDMSH